MAHSLPHSPHPMVYRVHYHTSNQQATARPSLYPDPYPGFCSDPRNLLALLPGVSPTAIYTCAAARVNLLKYKLHRVICLLIHPPCSYLSCRICSHLLCMTRSYLPSLLPWGSFLNILFSPLTWPHTSSICLWAFERDVLCSQFLKSPPQLMELPFSTHPSRVSSRVTWRPPLIPPGSCQCSSVNPRILAA